MYKIICLMLLLFIFDGCTTKTLIEPKLIYKDKIVLIAPPDNVLTKIDIPKPPNKKKFIESTNSDRIHSLSIYVIDLLNSLGTANNKLDSLKEWKNKQEEIYNGKIKSTK